MGTGGGEGFSLKPDFSTYALLSVWESQHHFEQQLKLNSVYKRVVSAKSGTNPSKLLKLSNDDFSRAFDQVPYVIKGIENLPENPQNIFIYNHLMS